MTDARRQRVIGGTALIALGLGLWVLQRMDVLGPAAFYLLVGGVLLAAYVAWRRFLFLVPACILLGLGAGTIGRGSLLDLGDSSMLGLGLGFGFVAIFLIALLYERKTHWWPLIPGTALIALSLDKSQEVFRFLYSNWPLALVVVGILILLGVFGLGSRGSGSRRDG